MNDALNDVVGAQFIAPASGLDKSSPYNAGTTQRQEHTLNILTRLFTIAVCYSLLAPAVYAATETVAVNNAWIREAPPNAPVLSGYAQIANGTKKTVAVTAIRSEAFEKVEIHTSEIKDGVARMTPVPQLEIKSRHAVTLAPTAMHLMLIGPKKPLRAGDHVAVQFTFSNGTTINAHAEVRKETSDEAPHEHGHH